MWECSYAKEPFDLRLLVLWGLRRIWIVILGMVLGALILGGGYDLWNGVITGEKQYAVTTMYEVVYGSDPKTGYEYTYINDFTWNQLVTTDLFLEMLKEQGEKEGGRVAALLQEESFLQHPKNYLAADLPSDLRMPTTTVTTTDRELSVALNRAVQGAMEALGEYKLEIERIMVADTKEPTLVDNTPRTVQASILGAVSGALFVLFILFCHYCMSEGIWVPETFTFRFGIPMLGAIAASEKSLLEADAANLAYYFRGKEQIAVTAADPQLDLKAVTGCLPEIPDLEYVCIPSFEQVPEAAECLRKADGILLVVEAGRNGGRRIMHLIESLKVQDVQVTGALLWNADRRLLNRYYFGQRENKAKK